MFIYAGQETNFHPTINYKQEKGRSLKSSERWSSSVVLLAIVVTSKRLFCQ